MATVSVIIPAYNAARHFAETLDSVLAQTWQDFEVVIADDGSTDDTMAIAERYRRVHGDRFVLLRRQNQGPSAARNAAFAAARGRFFALLDSDDTWLPEFLASQLRVFEAHPEIAIVTGNGFNRGGPLNGLPVRAPDDPRPDPDLFEILRDETAIFIMTVFRREVYDAVGGFDERLWTNEDYEFWIRAARAGFRFTRNPTPLGYYRRREGSLSSSDLRMIVGILALYRRLLEEGPSSPEERIILERQIERFEAERLATEARAALESGDAGAAVSALDALRHHRRSLPMTLLAAVLRLAPRAGLALYRARQRLRPAPPPASIRPAAAGSA
jgi:glycosyltransferase involved in cell wall biosynthesis